MHLNIRVALNSWRRIVKATLSNAVELVHVNQLPLVRLVRIDLNY